MIILPSLNSYCKFHSVLFWPYFTIFHILVRTVRDIIENITPR